MSLPTPASTWTEPGVEAVSQGVWRIPLPLPGDGLRAVNVYALADGAGLTLVDGGWALDQAQVALARALRAIGAGLGDIRRFLVTHAHRDHYTLAIAVRRDFGARVLIGSGEAHAVERLVRPGHPALRTQFELLRRFGAEPVLAALRQAGIHGDVRDTGYERPDVYLDTGTDIEVGQRTIRAIATPGHTRGHLVYLDQAARLLFAGDHVLPHITPSVAFEVDPSRLALRDYLGSLRLVRALPDAILLPAHGPVAPSVHARIDELLDHHEERLAACAKALAEGAGTAYDVARHLFWTRRGRRLTELDPFNQMLAVLETALHLDLIVDRGQATVRDHHGVRRYEGIDTEII
jgi:glyoxylase-like metal-dependent hydrolase (beta-lactamase superfamily II)